MAKKTTTPKAKQPNKLKPTELKERVNATIHFVTQQCGYMTRDDSIEYLNKIIDDMSDKADRLIEQRDSE